MNTNRLISAMISVGLTLNTADVFAMFTDCYPKAEELCPETIYTEFESMRERIEQATSLKEIKGSSVDEYLENQIILFESHCPGVFRVNPETKERIDHYLLAKNLDCINSVLEKYPNMTQCFIIKLKRSGGTFEIKLTEEHPFAVFDYDSGLHQSISFNPKFYTSFEDILAEKLHAYYVLKNIDDEQFLTVDDTHIPEVATLREMGRWFELNTPTIPIVPTNKGIGKYGLTPIPSPSLQQSKLRAFRTQILEQFKTHGAKHISSPDRCFKNSDGDWFAKYFAHAWGTDKISGIGKHVLEWTEDYDKSLEVILHP